MDTDKFFDGLINSLSIGELNRLSSRIYSKIDCLLKKDVEAGEFPSPNDSEVELWRDHQHTESVRLYRDRNGTHFSIREIKAVMEHHIAKK